MYKKFYSRGANKRAKNYGMAIAQLHKGLIQIKRRNIFAKMDLLNDINGWISDTINKKNKLLNIRFINSIIKDINSSFTKLYRELPKQLIHRDIHPLNMIFLNNKLKRFIYFEIATYGIRIFDPCYCTTSILIGRFRDKKARLKWFSLLKSIFKGYNSINRLKKIEINAMFYVLLSIQLLFMAYMVKINRIKTAKFNQSALKWIYDNKNQINKKLESLMD